MISTISLVTFGLLFVIITTVIQSAPVGIISSPKKASYESIDSVKSHSANSIFISKLNDVKKKRNIDDYDRFDEESNEDDDMEIENKLQTKIKETPAKIHDNADKLVDIDNSNVFSDLKMSQNELTNLARKRRNIHFNDRSKRRHKRALSTYDFYNTDPFYESLIERRPTRSFAPIYWYPSSYTRNIRSALDSSFYGSPEWNIIYPNTIESDDIDEDLAPLFLNDDNDDDDDEYNRYPILIDESTIPYDNLQLQQEYNIDDLPIDEDEGYFFTRYGPIDNYFK